ncbi:MAG: uroporphyrinogen-III C-methyltransferase [Candidatus Omnitrophica bacterium]|nr:uroporphyrinogen-III C-methyltransferase [Candidatus Omnitrophota bacterium]
MKSAVKTILKIGSRSSPLAQAQVREVLALLAKKGKKPAFEALTFSTKGDDDKKTSLLAGAADDFFTDTLDRALLEHHIDIAVHSAKDLPKHLRSGLKIFALTPALDDSDALVARTTYTKLPNGSRIGTSSLLRKQQILALNPTFEIVDIRGTIQERLKLLKDGKVDAVIVATCALKRLGLEKEIKEVFPWEGTPLQGQLAVVGRTKDTVREKLFSVLDVRRKYGKVTLVGAGPGDPGLITVKGVEALKKADCVFYDYLVHKMLLDHAPQAEKVDAGKRKGCATMSQIELSRALKNKALAGKNVVRLKGGDPLIFGRGADEITYLRSYHIDVEVIPGVTSATGIPSAVGLPLTARGVSSSVAFLSAHGEGERNHNTALINIPDAETLVFLMGLTKIENIVDAVLKKGWAKETPVAVISKGTWVDQDTVIGTLKDIVHKVRAKQLTPPALIIIGKTVDLYAETQKSLQTILYCGTYPEKYKSLGRVIHFPMISIGTAKVVKPADVVADLKKADTILLTSRCGVKYFFEFLASRKFAFEQLRGKDFIVIGAATEQQLAKYGFSPRLVAGEESSEGLFKLMKRSLKLKGRRIIFPRSSLSNPYLEQHLTKAGAKVREVIVYETTKPAKRELPSGQIDQAIFTSPSTVRNFLEDYGAIPKGWAIFAKGKPTQRALVSAGYKSEILVSG